MAQLPHVPPFIALKPRKRLDPVLLSQELPHEFLIVVAAHRLTSPPRRARRRIPNAPRRRPTATNRKLSSVPVGAAFLNAAYPFPSAALIRGPLAWFMSTIRQPSAALCR